MSNNRIETNSHKNENNPNENYTQRQIRNSLIPSNDVHLQQTMLPLTQQQLYEQLQSLQLGQQQQYYSGQIIPPLPLNAAIPMTPAYYNQLTLESQQQGMMCNGYPDTNLQYHHPSSNVPSTMINPQQPQQTSTGTTWCDAPPFSPSVKNTNLNEIKATVDESTPVTDDPDTKTATSTNSYIYDLKKYKHDYFISKLSCDFDRDVPKFGSPTGICTLNDDRLLVANFDRDAVILIDINGVVHQIYKDLPTPKDVLYYSTNPSQAVVATRKEVVILDLNTSKVVVRSKLRGFYPWNIQYIQERETFAACDPSGERIVFLDKNLADIGGWSFNDQASGYPQTQTYQKVYPYAAYFLPDDTSFVLTHRESTCQLRGTDTNDGVTKRFFNIPPTLLSYSIHVDSAKKCLIADKINHRLVSVDKDSTIEEYKCKSIQEPYSMTFLSTGTLCVTAWNKSFGTNGGVAIISEVDLKKNQ